MGVPTECHRREVIFLLVPPSSVGSLLDELWLWLPKRQLPAGWRDVLAPVSALNWMHGAACRQAGESITVASASKHARLRMEVQVAVEGDVHQI